MSGVVMGFLEGLGQDYMVDKANEFAEENFQPVKDPFYEKLPNGKQIRRKLPDYCSKEESKIWKKLQNKAWSHDRSCCGCCCWTDGIGWAPTLAILPVIGPVLMYWVHTKLIDYANKQYQLPADLLVKMHGNIGLDLAISLVPILGILFSWMHASSTRNCAMIYNYIVERNLEKVNREKKMNEQRQREAQMRQQQKQQLIEQRKREQEQLQRQRQLQNPKQQTQQQQQQRQQQQQQAQFYQQNLERQQLANKQIPTSRYDPPTNAYPKSYPAVYNNQVRPPPPVYPVSSSRAQRPYI